MIIMYAQKYLKKKRIWNKQNNLLGGNLDVL